LHQENPILRRKLEQKSNPVDEADMAEVKKVVLGMWCQSHCRNSSHEDMGDMIIAIFHP
jgi:hypothetical protein